eukprot:1850131-Ditylum_brightwellii.AAC.1
MAKKTSSASISGSPVTFLILLIAIISSINATLDGSATRYDCPVTLDTLTPLSGFPAPSSGDVLIHLPPAPAGQLCTLSRLSGNGQYYIPVGRSYDGYDWESVAGIHARISFDNCGTEPSGTDRVCQASIPAQFAYDLTTYAHTPTDKAQ